MVDGPIVNLDHNSTTTPDPRVLDGPDGPRAVLRRMVLRLGELAAVGAHDPVELVAPFVDTLVELRDRARAQCSWFQADDLRERLTTAGITVRDTPEGTVWSLTPR